MLRLDHVVIPIWEVKRSIAFYRDVLGLKLVESLEGDDWGGYPWLMLIFALSDKREIVLVNLKGAKQPAPSKLPKDAHHIALAETSAIERWRVKFDAAKIKYWEEEYGDQRSIYCEDPNGLVIEITAPPSSPPDAEDPMAMKRVEKFLRSRAAAKTKRK